jgi:hypothetical protein
MNIQQFIKQTFEDKNGYCFRPRIYCKDGFSLSVQGSAGHYCSPRVTCNSYSTLEVGFPSSEEIDLIPYAESPDNPTGTVYGWTPIGIIDKIIESHGGIDEIKTFKTATK